MQVLPTRPRLELRLNTRDERAQIGLEPLVRELLMLAALDLLREKIRDRCEKDKGRDPVAHTRLVPLRDALHTRSLRAARDRRRSLSLMRRGGMGRVGIEPTTLGLRVPCSTS